MRTQIEAVAELDEDLAALAWQVGC